MTPTLTTKEARNALLSVIPHADASLGAVTFDTEDDDDGGDPIVYWSAPVYARDIDGEPRLTWES